MQTNILPRPSGAFFVTWFKKLPVIPKEFDGPFVGECLLHFRDYPTKNKVKPIERAHWFWWAGLIVTMVFTWFTANYAVRITNILCMIVGSFCLLWFSWCSFRHIRYANWICNLRMHKDYMDIFTHVYCNKRHYAQMTVQQRKQYDALEKFVKACTEAADDTFKN